VNISTCTLIDVYWSTHNRQDGRKARTREKEGKKKINTCLHFHSHLHTCKLKKHLKNMLIII